MTQKESPEQTRTLTTSNPSAAEVSQQRAISGSVTSGLIKRITESDLFENAGAISSVIPGVYDINAQSIEQATVPPSVLRDLWVTKFGAGWTDSRDIGNDYYPIQRQLWFAGMIQKMYRSDAGREFWRIVDANY